MVINGEIALSNEIEGDNGEPNNDQNNEDYGELSDGDPFIYDVPCSLTFSGVYEIDEILQSG